MLHNIYTICKYYIHIARKELFLCILFHIGINSKILVTYFFKLISQQFQNPDNTYSKISVNCHSQNKMLVWLKKKVLYTDMIANEWRPSQVIHSNIHIMCNI